MQTPDDPLEFSARPPPAEPAEAESKSPEPKRRKIRKGTRSCWGCKRRKTRCIYAAPADAVCVGCQRRGANCVSQEFPEEICMPVDRGRHMGDRIVRVEALVEQLVRQVGPGAGGLAGPVQDPAASSSRDPNPSPTVPAPKSISSELGRCLGIKPCSDVAASVEDENLEAQVALSLSKTPNDRRLWEALCEAFPPSGDMEIYRSRASPTILLFSISMLKPLRIIERDGPPDLDSVFKPPCQDTHPVLLAKHMLILALTLHYVHLSETPQFPGLSEAPRDRMRRLGDTAIRLVVTNNEFLGSIESLECLVLESQFENNCGRVRRAWLTLQRATALAQLMGIHRGGPHRPLKTIDPGTAAYPQFLWHRILWAGRMLSLLLGLPQGTLDMSMASPAALASDAPVGRLERIHSTVMARILERNESDPDLDGFALTQELDMELQNAANQLPNKSWLPLDLGSVDGDSLEGFRRSVLFARQVHHYYLLIQLHLPYMLRSSAPGAKGAKYDYSRNTCVTASREVITRCFTSRYQTRMPFYCRQLDFWSLTAALTLLFAHIDGHAQRPGDNMLAHHRASDRGMVEAVLEHMDYMNEINKDPLGERSAELLRRLLAIEAYSARGGRTPSGKGVGNLDSPANGCLNGHGTLRISIPYFGVVRVDPRGVISKEANTATATTNDSPTTITTFSLSTVVGSPPSPLSAYPPDLPKHPPPDPQQPLRQAPAHMQPQPQPQEPARVAAGPCTQASAEPYADMPASARPLYHHQQDQHQHPAWLQQPAPSQYAAPYPGVASHAMPAFETQQALQFSYPALTAGLDGWALQGFDVAYFDNLMKGAAAMDAEGGAGPSADTSGVGYNGQPADGWGPWQ